MSQRRLIPLGEGAYSVAEVCRILGSGMTPRKVHYWLDTGLLTGQPISRGRRGVPTVLTFRQMLEIKTVQYLRDTIGVSLREVRAAFEWILHNLFDEREHITFDRGPNGWLVARLRSGEEMTVPGGQLLLDMQVAALTDTVQETLDAWDQSMLGVTNHPHLVTSTRILGGAPVVRGTRIDTTVLLGFVSRENTFDDTTIADIKFTYPRLEPQQITDALVFEGATPVAG